MIVKNNLKNQINLSGLQKDRKFEKFEMLPSKEGRLKTAQVLSYFIFAFFLQNESTREKKRKRNKKTLRLQFICHFRPYFKTKNH